MAETARKQVRTAQFELDKPYLARKTRIKGFIMTSALSVLASMIVFALVIRADILDAHLPTFMRAMGWFKPFMALAAASPLLASLLVGYGYMSRGIKRRAAEKAAAEAAAAK